MTKNIVVLGGGVGGLASAIALGRAGHRVTVLEQDPAPTTDDPDEAFLTWRRNGVTQARQGHVILARATNLLREHAPDVLDDLSARGAEATSSPLLAMFPPEMHQPGDEELGILPCRRIPLELALRRAALATQNVEIRSGVKAIGLTTENGAAVPRVTGVVLTDGALDADLLVDAGGRRSPVRTWLVEAGAEMPPERVQDCGIAYYGRYFRLRDERLDPWELLASRGELDYCWYTAFPGDRDSYGLILVVPPWDRKLRVLRDEGAWDAAARSFPMLVPWVDIERTEPLRGVEAMGGHRNVLRPFVADGRPAFTGCIPVGDALCTTDALFGWGLSLAMYDAFELARVLDGDPEAAAVAYSDAVMDEAEACYRTASASSRVRIAAWKGREPDLDNPDDEREVLFREGVGPALFDDPTLLRAAFRRLHLLDHPYAIFDDADVMERARRVQREHAGQAPPELGPSREGLLELLGVERTAVV